jgi:hypothetical protein
MTMLVRISLVLILSSILMTTKATAEECTETKVGGCFSVHGRYAIYVENNGIWVIGTRRLLVTAGDEKLDAMINTKGDWQDYALVGDFAVCPMTEFQRGHKQTVCIKSYSNLKMIKRP